MDKTPDKIRHKVTGQKALGFPHYNPKTRIMTFYKDAEQTEAYEVGAWEFIPQEPYELFGIECGEGWYKLVQPVIDYVEEYNKGKNEDEQIIIQQIKSQFATLCIYLSHKTEELEKLINDAEEEANRTCELCGSKTDVGLMTTGWVTVMCRNCLLSNDKRMKDVYWKSFSDNHVYLVHTDMTMELFR